MLVSRLSGLNHHSSVPDQGNSFQAHPPSSSGRATLTTATWGGNCAIVPGRVPTNNPSELLVTSAASLVSTRKHPTLASELIGYPILSDIHTISAALKPSIVSWLN